MTDLTRPPRFAVRCGGCDWTGARRHPAARPCPSCGLAGELLTVRHQEGLAPGRGRTYLLCMDWQGAWTRDPDDWRYLLGPDGDRIYFHGQHYTGKSFDPARRLVEYLEGRGGVNYVDAAMALGAIPRLVLTWPLPAGEDWKEWRIKHRPARSKACTSNKCGQRKGVNRGMTRHCPRCKQLR
jgi:hypothetical protein